jgi:hypothetical protein
VVEAEGVFERRRESSRCYRREVNGVLRSEATKELGWPTAVDQQHLRRIELVSPLLYSLQENQHQ